MDGTVIYSYGCGGEMTGKTAIVARVYDKAYWTKQIAALYSQDKKTIRKWIESFLHEIGPRNAHNYTIRQVKIIFEKLPSPEPRRKYHRYQICGISGTIGEYQVLY